MPPAANGLQALGAAALSGSTRLTALRLGSNCVGPDGMAALAMGPLPCGHIAQRLLNISRNGMQISCNILI